MYIFMLVLCQLNFLFCRAHVLFLKGQITSQKLIFWVLLSAQDVMSH